MWNSLYSYFFLSCFVVVLEIQVSRRMVIFKSNNRSAVSAVHPVNLKVMKSVTNVDIYFI